MDIVILIICIILLLISLASLIATFVIFGALSLRLSKISAGGNNEKKLDELKESIYNEFSRNRSEQNSVAQSQRAELAKQIEDINKRLESITEANNQQLYKIRGDLAESVEKLNDKNSKMAEKQNSVIVEYLTKIGEINEQRLGEMTEGLNLVREKYAEMNEKQNQLINDSLEKIRESNENKLKEVTEGINLIREKNAEMNDKQNLRIEESLGKIRESNEKKLEEMRAVVDEKLSNTLTQRLDSSFKTVSTQLENLYKALGEMKEMSGGITEHVSSLNRVLTNVKSRGTWAEVQLKNILDQTIPNMYVENYAPTNTSKERVEFAIKIPSGENYSEITYLPLDSKFPMEDYVRLCDAADKADAEATKAARKALEERVIQEARSICKYISVPKTTPFAIMYLASEGLYAEIASSPNAIPERLQTEFNIMVAGPSTITALLNSLSMGFRFAAINEKANEVRKILSAVKSQYDKFTEVLAKAKKKIDEAGKSLDDAQSRNEQIQKKLKNIEELESSEANEVLGIAANNSSDVDE